MLKSWNVALLMSQSMLADVPKVELMCFCLFGGTSCVHCCAAVVFISNNVGICSSSIWWVSLISCTLFCTNESTHTHAHTLVQGEQQSENEHYLPINWFLDRFLMSSQAKSNIEPCGVNLGLTCHSQALVISQDWGRLKGTKADSLIGNEWCWLCSHPQRRKLPFFFKNQALLNLNQFYCHF